MPFRPGWSPGLKGKVVVVTDERSLPPGADTGAAPTGAAFAVAKAGVAAFTHRLAAEVATSGVRANCLAPARNARPEPVAFAALYLASDAAASINAATLAIAGRHLAL